MIPAQPRMTQVGGPPRDAIPQFFRELAAGAALRASALCSAASFSLSCWAATIGRTMRAHSTKAECDGCKRNSTNDRTTKSPSVTTCSTSVANTVASPGCGIKGIGGLGFGVGGRLILSSKYGLYFWDPDSGMVELQPGSPA